MIEPVEPFELLGQAHLDRLDAEATQHRDVLAERALQGEDADLHATSSIVRRARSWHTGSSRAVTGATAASKPSPRRPTSRSQQSDARADGPEREVHERSSPLVDVFRLRREERHERPEREPLLDEVRRGSGEPQSPEDGVARPAQRAGRPRCTRGRRRGRAATPTSARARTRGSRRRSRDRRRRGTRTRTDGRRRRPSRPRRRRTRGRRGAPGSPSHESPPPKTPSRRSTTTYQTTAEITRTSSGKPEAAERERRTAITSTSSTIVSRPRPRVKKLAFCGLGRKSNPITSSSEPASTAHAKTATTATRPATICSPRRSAARARARAAIASASNDQPTSPPLPCDPSSALKSDPSEARANIVPRYCRNVALVQVGFSGSRPWPGW